MKNFIKFATESVNLNENFRKKIGIQAQKDVINFFPENEIYKNLSDLYKKLIDNN